MLGLDGSLVFLVCSVGCFYTSLVNIIFTCGCICIACTNIELVCFGLSQEHVFWVVSLNTLFILVFGMSTLFFLSVPSSIVYVNHIWYWSYHIWYWSYLYLPSQPFVRIILGTFLLWVLALRNMWVFISHPFSLSVCKLSQLWNLRGNKVHSSGFYCCWHFLERKDSVHAGLV